MTISEQKKCGISVKLVTLFYVFWLQLQDQSFIKCFPSQYCAVLPWSAWIPNMCHVISYITRMSVSVLLIYIPKAFTLLYTDYTVSHTPKWFCGRRKKMTSLFFQWWIWSRTLCVIYLFLSSKLNIFQDIKALLMALVKSWK